MSLCGRHRNAADSENRSILSAFIGQSAFFYYVFGGFFSSVVNLFAEKEAWHVPLGFWTLFLAGKINITFHTGETLLANVGFLFWSLLCFGITGWFTGLIGAALYNLCSRWFGIQVEGAGESILDESPRRRLTGEESA
jgi:hypothetical protein